MAGILAMMAAMNIRLSVTTAPGQALPCAGTAAGVLGQRMLVLEIREHALTDPMTQIQIIRIALFAQKRALCPAQVFLGIVRRCVTDDPSHTCKKRGIAGIYPRNFFWIFRKILG